MTPRKKAVAKKDEESRDVDERSMLDQFAHDAGEGLENITRDDTKIPFLQVLQTNSPQAQEDSDGYVEGSKPGWMLNSVTGDLYDGKEGALVVPVHFEKVYVEWRPRDAGGGFIAEHRTREDAYDNVQEGNDIVDTAHHYCLIKTDEGHWAPVVIPCKSTFLSVSRGWNAMMQSVLLKTSDGRTFTPPSYACIYSLSTVRQQNDKGSWYNLSIERVSTVDDPELYAMAKVFRQTLVDGGVSLSYESLQDEEDVASAEDLPTF